MLLEEGFEVVSIDASDKMLKYALKARWNRRKEPEFDKWGKNKLVVFKIFVSVGYQQYMHFPLFSVIEEANWLTLYDDIEKIIGAGFDAVICLGNSFAHMLDSYGDQRDQK